MLGRELLIVYSENSCLKSSSLCFDMDNVSIYVAGKLGSMDLLSKLFFINCEMCMVPCCKVLMQGDGVRVGVGATN